MNLHYLLKLSKNKEEIPLSIKYNILNINFYSPGIFIN
jgi:hypothetical protein